MTWPVLKGTFISPSPNPPFPTLTWTQGQVDQQWRDMLDAGLDTVIIQWSANYYAGNCYYPGSTRWSSNYSLVDMIMNAAERFGGKVWLGLSVIFGAFDDHANRINSSFTLNYSNAQKDTINELYAIYGSSPAFAGWYIPDELSAGALADDSTAQANMKWYFGTVAGWAHSHGGGKEVLTSPNFIDDATVGLGATSYATKAVAALDACDIMAPQDCMGWHLYTQAQSTAYYTALRSAWPTAKKLWHNADMFDTWMDGANPNGGSICSPKRLQDQLSAANSSVTNHIGYAYLSSMSPQCLGTDYFHIAYKTYASAYISSKTVAPTGVTASGENTGGGEVAINLKDSKLDTKWLTFTNAGWVDFTFSGSMRFSRYYVVSANDHSEWDPKNWTLQGSNDGVNWTSVHTVTNASFPARRCVNSYDILSLGYYSHYRLNITANNGGSYTQLSEVAFEMHKLA